MHCSQRQRYVVAMLYLFSHLSVFETHFDGYFLFHSMNFCKFTFIAVLYDF